MESHHYAGKNKEGDRGHWQKRDVRMEINVGMGFIKGQERVVFLVLLKGLYIVFIVFKGSLYSLLDLKLYYLFLLYDFYF
jgi:hypothetical protein